MSNQTSLSSARALANVPVEYRDIAAWPAIEIGRLEHKGSMPFRVELDFTPDAV
jgi:hypothetical protein